MKDPFRFRILRFSENSFLRQIHWKIAQCTGSWENEHPIHCNKTYEFKAVWLYADIARFRIFFREYKRPTSPILNHITASLRELTLISSGRSTCHIPGCQFRRSSRPGPVWYGADTPSLSTALLLPRVPLLSSRNHTLANNQRVKKSVPNSASQVSTDPTIYTLRPESCAVDGPAHPRSCTLQSQNSLVLYIDLSNLLFAQRLILDEHSLLMSFQNAAVTPHVFFSFINDSPPTIIHLVHHFRLPESSTFQPGGF